MATCFSGATYTAALSSGSPLPDFITFTDSSFSFSVYTDDPNNVKTYKIVVSGTYSNSYTSITVTNTATMTFKLTVEALGYNKYPPEFDEALED